MIFFRKKINKFSSYTQRMLSYNKLAGLHVLSNITAIFAAQKIIQYD